MDRFGDTLRANPQIKERVVGLGWVCFENPTKLGNVYRKLAMIGYVDGLVLSFFSSDEADNQKLLFYCRLKENQFDALEDRFLILANFWLLNGPEFYFPKMISHLNLKDCGQYNPKGITYIERHE